MTAREIAQAAMTRCRDVAEAGLVQVPNWKVFICHFRQIRIADRGDCADFRACGI